MYCTKCGFDINDNMKFCPSCGNKLNFNRNNNNPVESTSIDDQKKSDIITRKIVKYPIVLMAILLLTVAAGTIVFFVYFFPKTDISSMAEEAVVQTTNDIQNSEEELEDNEESRRMADIFTAQSICQAVFNDMESGKLIEVGVFEAVAGNPSSLTENPVPLGQPGIGNSFIVHYDSIKMTCFVTLNGFVLTSEVGINEYKSSDSEGGIGCESDRIIRRESSYGEVEEYEYFSKGCLIKNSSDYSSNSLTYLDELGRTEKVVLDYLVKYITYDEQGYLLSEEWRYIGESLPMRMSKEVCYDRITYSYDLSNQTFNCEKYIEYQDGTYELLYYGGTFEEDADNYVMTWYYDDMTYDIRIFNSKWNPISSVSSDGYYNKWYYDTRGNEVAFESGSDNDYSIMYYTNNYADGVVMNY